MRWWDHYHHPEESDFCYFYAGLNLVYLLLRKRRVSFAGRSLPGVMLAFVLLRGALLLTLDAPEPRYTLECFPVVIALAGVALGGRRDDEQPDVSGV